MLPANPSFEVARIAAVLLSGVPSYGASRVKVRKFVEWKAGGLGESASARPSTAPATAPQKCRRERQKS
jgi:hypothetical protein